MKRMTIRSLSKYLYMISYMMLAVSAVVLYLTPSTTRQLFHLRFFESVYAYPSLHIESGDLVAVQPLRYDALKKGDPIAYYSNESFPLFTAQIITEMDVANYTLQAGDKGRNNHLSKDQVIGKVLFRIPTIPRLWHQYHNVLYVLCAVMILLFLVQCSWHFWMIRKANAPRAVSISESN